MPDMMEIVSKAVFEKELADARGSKFIRRQTAKEGRGLYSWMPVEPSDQPKQIAQSVKRSLNRLSAVRTRG